ncbi:MAG: MFS transporter [Kiloniellales bacterium]
MKQTGPTRQPIFYGWWVIAIAFVTMGVAITARSSFSLLYPEILAEFGWSRNVTAGAFSLGFLISTAMLPIIGVLMDRSGPRLIIPLGALLVILGYGLVTLIDSPWAFYATMGLLVINGSMAMSYIVHSMFLPAWFVRNRGLAVGIAFSGVGVGGYILMPVIQTIIDDHGWRTACLAMAGLIAVAIIPLNALFQRSSPQEMGLEPDGGPAPRRDNRPAPDPIVDRAWTEIDWTLGRAARTARFWWIAVGFFSALFAWYAIQAHQTQFLIEEGFSSLVAAEALGLVALFGIAGQIVTGWLSDRLGREIAWSLAMLGFAACYLILVVMQGAPSGTLLYTMIAFQGLLGYGLAVLFGAVMTEIFSGRHIARIVAVLSLSGNVGAAAGVWFLGAVHDASGSYLIGFWVCFGFALFSILCVWFAAPRKVRLVAGQAARRQAKA